VTPWNEYFSKIENNIKYLFILRVMVNFSINNTKIDIDDKSEIDKDFKIIFTRLLSKALIKEGLLQHLKKVHIQFKDDDYYNKIYGYINEEDVEEGELRGRVDKHGKEIIIELNIAYSIIYYRKFGNQSLLNALEIFLAHELVHYVHMTINNRIRHLQRDYEILLKMYKKKYSEFEKDESDINMSSLLRLVTLFIDNLIVEGFAMLYQESKKGNVRFTKQFFNSNYADALKLAEVCNKKFKELIIIKNKKDFLKKVSSFIHKEPFVTSDYYLGLHVVYALIFLSEEDATKSIDQILQNFVTWYGKEKPKKLVREYEIMMLKQGLKPVIGQGSESIINIKKIEKEWRKRYSIWSVKKK